MEEVYKSILVYPETHQRIKMIATKEGLMIIELIDKVLDGYENEIKEEGATMDKLEDNIKHPEHYNYGIEAIDYIESWSMNFNIGNVIKYVSRAKYKHNELEDLKKALWYLEREIKNLEG